MGGYHSKSDALKTLTLHTVPHVPYVHSGTHAFSVRSRCRFTHVFVVNTANKRNCRTSPCEMRGRRMKECTKRVLERVYEGASRSLIPLYFLDNRIHGRRENAETPVGRACGVVSLHPNEPVFAELLTVAVLD